MDASFPNEGSEVTTGLAIAFSLFGVICLIIVILMLASFSSMLFKCLSTCRKKRQVETETSTYDTISAATTAVSLDMELLSTDSVALSLPTVRYHQLLSMAVHPQARWQHQQRGEEGEEEGEERVCGANSSHLSSLHEPPPSYETITAYALYYTPPFQIQVCFII